MRTVQAILPMKMLILLECWIKCGAFRMVGYHSQVSNLRVMSSILLVTHQSKKVSLFRCCSLCFVLCLVKFLVKNYCYHFFLGSKVNWMDFIVMNNGWIITCLSFVEKSSLLSKCFHPHVVTCMLKGTTLKLELTA